MSSLDSEPASVGARPSTQISTPTQASQSGTKSLSPDESGRSGQVYQTHSTLRYGNAGVALTSTTSIPNRGPWGRSSPLERSRPLGLVDTVVAEAYRKSTINIPDATHDNSWRKFDTSSRLSPQPTYTGSTSRHGDSHPIQTASRPRSALFTTSQASRGRSGGSQGPVDTIDEEDPSNVTCRVLQDVFTGKLSKKDRSRMREKYCRAFLGGDP